MAVNRTKWSKNTHSCQDVMLRSDQVKDNTAGLIHMPFRSSSNISVNFTVHT